MLARRVVVHRLRHDEPGDEDSARGARGRAPHLPGAGGRLGGISPATLYTWTIDLTAPTVLSIKRAGPSPTDAQTVSWTVKFSEDVTGVDAGDFVLTRTGGLTGGSVGGRGASGRPRRVHRHLDDRDG